MVGKSINKRKRVKEVKCPKGYKEKRGNSVVTLAYCAKCHKYQPFGTQGMTHKKHKAELTIVFCAICDTVHNLTRAPKFKKVRYSELKKKGWTAYDKKI